MTTTTILSIFGIVASSIISIWAILKFIVSQNYRLDDNVSKILIKKIQTDATFKFELNNEFSVNKKYPSIYEIFCYIDGCFFLFKRNERLLNAGWQSKDTVSEIYFFRWQKDKVINYIKTISSVKDSINVMLLGPNGSDKLGELQISEPTISIDKDLYEDIEADIKDMLENKKSKTGCLLYGKPGTGKTRLVKYLSQKYILPIYTVYLNPDFSNLEVLMMFSSIPEKCIVLFEDFDNYFNKRDCTLKNENIKFTFDAIINALDGIYNDYNQVVFIMTANDIDKIDDSIKLRSSRFKFVREITSPSYETRLKILGDKTLAEKTEGMTIDKIYFVESLIGKYTDDQIIEKANLNV
jgi:hypothetical protein